MRSRAIGACAAVALVACGAFGASVQDDVPDGGEVPDAGPSVSADAADGADGADAAWSPCTPTLRDGFERGTLVDGGWTGSSKAAAATLAIRDAGRAGNGLFVAMPGSDAGSTPAFLRRDIAGSKGDWSFCALIYVRLESATTGGAVDGPRLFAFDVDVGKAQQIGLEFSGKEVHLEQSSNGSCPGSGCGGSQNNIAVLTPDTWHAIALDVRAFGNRTERPFGDVRVTVDGKTTELPLDVALADRAKREFRLGLSSSLAKLSVTYDDVELGP